MATQNTVNNVGGGGGTPGGSDEQVQFNDAGSFGGDAGLTFNKTTNDLTVGNDITAGGDVTGANLSGTNTGDQNLFGTIAVSGQSNVVADTTNDTLTLVAGTNVTITTDASTDSVTISAAGGSGGTPGGSNTQVQFNDSSSFGGDAGFTYDKATDTATLAGDMKADRLGMEDTNSSHYLYLTPGSDLTADRELTLTTGDAARTLTMTGDATISGTNTGDQTITLSGDVTGTGTGAITATIANDAVTYAKMQNVSATDKLLGRSSAGAGDVQEIDCTAAGRALLDDADASAQRTTLGLGTLATQNGTFSGTSSGTNTGDQTITNSSDATSHTVTLSASGGSVQLIEGTNITLTTGGTGANGTVTIAASGGSGDVTAASNLTDNAIVRGDGGVKGVQTSGVTISDTDVVSGATQLNVDNLRMDGNTISTTNTDGDLTLAPNGTGDVVMDRIKASSSAGLIVQNASGTQQAEFGAGGGTNAAINGTTNMGTASADYHQIAGGTGTITDTATGSSTNISINLVPKGTGRLQENAVNVVTVSSTDTLTNKTLTDPTINGGTIKADVLSVGELENTTSGIEVGNSSASTASTPYIDFHYSDGVGGQTGEDFNVRLINTADNTLSIQADSGRAIVGITGNLAIASNQTTGDVLFVEGDNVTTGDVAEINGDALTSGRGLYVSSSSTSTASRELVRIQNAGGSATGATVPLAILTDGVVSTNFKRGININGTTIWTSNNTNPNGSLSGTSGDICLYGNGGSMYVCSSTTNWDKVIDGIALLSEGGTGASLTDPNADRIMFWDDSAGAVTWLTPSTGLTISGTNMTVDNPTESLIIACSDESTALTTGTAKVTFRMPYAFTLSAVRASVTTAPTGASLLTVDINESGTSILSTKITIDASEKTSTTAATPPVISDTALADDAEITVDIDQVGSTVAGAGLKVYLIGKRA